MYRQNYKLRLRRQPNYSRNGISSVLYTSIMSAATEREKNILPPHVCRGLEGGMNFATFHYNKHFQAYQKDAFTLVQIYDTLSKQDL